MKSIFKWLNVLTLIALMAVLGLRDVLPAKADAPNQTITILTNAPLTAANGESFIVNAATDSGLDVSYSAAGDACTNLGATFTMTSDSGECIVQYDQAGGSGYDPAPQLTEIVTAQPGATATATPTATMTATATGTATAITTVTATVTSTATVTATAPASPTMTATPIGTGLFVAASGNDQGGVNPCTTLATPCHSIQQAITKASAGNTIFVTKDIFKGSGITTIVTVNKNISISGGWNNTFNAQTGLTILDGQDTRLDILVTTNASASIEKFAIINSLASGLTNNGTLTLKYGVIYNNNKANGIDGGGIYNTGTLLITNTAIYNNTADGRGGGGIFNVGSLSVKNSTITGNQATTGGGIMYTPTGHIDTNPSVILNNVTLSGNLADYGKSIYRAADIAPVYLADPILYNTIMANNNCHGSLTSANNNLIYLSSGCTITGSYLNANPLLGTFSATNGYFPLKHGSPAIDAGNPATPNSGTGSCEAADQFGTNRPLDADGNAVAVCDIGAYEAATSVASIPPTANSIDLNDGSSQSALVSNQFSNPLSVLVKDQYDAPIAGVTVTFTAPASGASGTFAESGTHTTSAITDGSGIATTTAFTANTTSGSYLINASISGLATSVQFRLANMGTASNLEITSGSPQAAGKTSAFQKPLSVLVKDQGGNPVADVTVTFTGPASGVGGTFGDSGTNITTAISDGGGFATAATFTANALMGSYTVSASASGVISPAQFDLANSVGPGLYVANTGNNANTCLTANDPCLTINAAVGKASSGASIYVASGNYTDSNSSAVAYLWKCIHLSGGWNANFNSQNDLSTIDGENQRGAVHGGCSIDHFRIQNSNTSGIESYGAITVSNSVIRNNHAGSGGSAIFAAGDLTINNSTLENNVSVTNGGAIEIYVLNSLTVNNSIITENQGGGIFLNGVSGGGSAPAITITNSTITNNTGGGGLAINASYPARIVTLRNSILSGNTAASGPDCKGTINVADHNIISNATGCTIISSTGNLFNVNPLLSTFPLGPLASRMLLSGSPAIDAGNPVTCLSTDQRGSARKDGDANGSIICDIGAYEYNPVTGPASVLGVSSGSNQHALPNTSFTAPLVVYVLDAEGNPVSGVTVTFTAPATGPSGTFANNTNITSAISNSNGLATSSIFSANGQAGSYNVIATAPGLTAVNFTFTNAVWFVSPLGSDSNACNTPSLPCLTINAAINKASNGDLIKIASGTYNGSGSTVVTISKSINLLGGWDTDFVTRTGQSIIDGQEVRNGISVTGAATLSQMIVQNSYIGIQNGGTLNMNRVALIHNQNGLRNTSGNATVINSTISSNYAFGLAGSAVSNTMGTVDFQYSTITNNSSAYGLEAIYSVNGGAIIKIANSILANNPDGDCHVDKDNMISGGNNLFSATRVCYDYGNNSFVPHPSDQIGVDPQLSSLVAAGFHFPSATSPAIDHAGATCPSIATDQRGMSRPQGSGCDVGAYEYKAGVTATLMGTNKGANQSNPVKLTYPIPLSVYVLDAMGSPVQNISVTFTAPGTDASGTFADTHTNSTTAVTNSSGIATAPAFTANSTFGSFNVSATASGLSDATFTLTNLPVPSTLSPSGKTIIPKPTYRWSSINGATKYQYELWKGSSLIYRKTVPPTVCAGTTCSNTPAITLKPGNYKWRIQTMLGNTWQGFSPYKTFTVAVKAGFWPGKGLSFYVAPTQTSIKKYTVFIYVSGCGAYAITRSTAIRINSTSQFSFTGSFYANGTFTSPLNSAGQVGFSHFLIKGCGYISGGPFNWTATWKNSSQPAVIQGELLIPTLIEPLATVQDTGSYTVERVGP